MAINARALSMIYLQQQISAAPLAMLRVLFGFLMVVSTTRFLLLGWVNEQYIQPTLHFPYPGFEWVVSLGNPGMYILFGVLILASLLVMVGLFYRVSIAVVFFVFTYIELIDVTYYLNHYYFVSIVAFLLCLLPAHRYFSVDAQRNPSLFCETVPRWTTDVMKLQIGIVYCFAGIAKINSDWLLHALPLKIWLPAHTDVPIIGSLFLLDWVPYVFSWCGMLFDCTVVFFLLYKRTRVLAYVAVVIFHVITGILFQIGVFPLVMIAVTTIFFEAKNHVNVLSGMSKLLPKLGNTSPVHTQSQSIHLSHWIVVVVTTHIILQLLIPFRYLLYPGNLYWREEGYRYSWRVMLVEKSGTATFTVTDNVTKQQGTVVNSDFLNSHQEKQMSFQPDMILYYAHWLHNHYKSKGISNPIITADVWVTLNGRPSKQLIHPHVDLSKESVGLHRYSWITDAY